MIPTLYTRRDVKLNTFLGDLALVPELKTLMGA
jgi:hypothetical protein